MKYPKAVSRLMNFFYRFQGVGRKTAERFAFELLNGWQKDTIEAFAQALKELPDSIIVCSECRTPVDSMPCPFCDDERKRYGALCVVASPKDVYAIEATAQFPGTFYVLGGLLSPLSEYGIGDMGIDLLKRRIQQEESQEVILALDSSVEGDATVTFLRSELEPLQVIISRLASGLPVGTSLDFVDRGTLSRAFSGRQRVGAGAISEKRVEIVP